MKEEDTAGQLNRREFLRELPRHLLQKFVAAAREGIFAFSPRAEEEVPVQNLVAQVEISRCLAWSGLICQQCYLACPKRDHAIEMRDQKPAIAASICDGCAMCVRACETVNDLTAIRMVSCVPASRNITAEKEVAP
jgi:Pyruvate/2-oxoacid:ferredoxin oxidoreductase delta subunit